MMIIELNILKKERRKQFQLESFVGFLRATEYGVTTMDRR